MLSGVQGFVARGIAHGQQVLGGIGRLFKMLKFLLKGTGENLRYQRLR